MGTSIALRWPSRDKGSVLIWLRNFPSRKSPASCPVFTFYCRSDHERRMDVCWGFCKWCLFQFCDSFLHYMYSGRDRIYFACSAISKMILFILLIILQLSSFEIFYQNSFSCKICNQEHKLFFISFWNFVLSVSQDLCRPRQLSSTCQREL